MPRFVDLKPSEITKLLDTSAGEKEALARVSDYKRERVPFYITDLLWERAGYFVVMYCNPKSVNIKLSWREKDQVIKGGIVRHSWRSHGSYLQEVQFDFEFQTGNTMPRIVDNKIVRGPGLDNLYELLELFDHPRIDPVTGEPNYTRIFFNTAMFPTFNLLGFFDPEDFTIPQTADEPNGISFNQSFTSRIIYPKVTNASQLVLAFNESGALTMQANLEDQTILGVAAEGIDSLDLVSLFR